MSSAGRYSDDEGKGMGGVRGRERARGLTPWRGERDDWNLNNRIKPAASHSLISIDCF